MTANPLSPIPPIGSSTGMMPPPGGGRFKPIDPLRVLRQYAWVLVVLGIAGMILGVVTFVVLRLYMPKYTSLAYLEVLHAGADPWQPAGGGGRGSSNLEEVSALIQNEITRLHSRDVLQTALSKSEVRQTAWFQEHGHDIVGAVRMLQDEMLGAGSPRDSMSIHLTMTTSQADDAPRILGAIIEVYLEKLRTQAEGESSGLLRVFQQQRAEAVREIEQRNEQLGNFLRDNNLNTLENQRNETSIAYENLATQRVTLMMQLSEMEEMYAGLVKSQERGETKPDADAIFEIEQFPGIERLTVDLRSMRVVRDMMLAKYGPQHPEVRQVEERIAAIEAEKDREVQRLLRERQAAQLGQAAKAIEAVKAQLATLDPQLEQASQRMTDFNDRLNRYQQLVERRDRAVLSRATADEAINDERLRNQRPDAVRTRLMVSPTNPPDLSFPKPLVVVPGVMLLVLSAGTGLLFLKELMDQRVKSPSDLKLLPDAELLGVVPDVNEDPSDTTAVERVVEKNPTGLMAESFRQVRTALLSRMDRRGYKTLMVTAARGGAGTSIVVQNLGASLAYNGRRVLIVDANFRRPAQHTLMGVPASPGLSEYLRGDSMIKVLDLVVPLEGVTLSVLPAGDAHGAHPELLEGPRFRSMLSQLESQFDLILIDTPPALLASDAQLLAKHADAIAMVVRAGEDERGMIGRMMNQLDGQRADVLGLILNGVQSSAGGYFRKSYQEFYRYRANGATLTRPRGDRTQPAGSA